MGAAGFMMSFRQKKKEWKHSFVRGRRESRRNENKNKKRRERALFFGVLISLDIYKCTRACGTCTLDITCPRQSSRSVKKRTTSLFSFFFFFVLLLILPPPTFFSLRQVGKKKKALEMYEE